jgi:NAD(P)-dependent dehydrogenase (short-subunit alcohol dehydrogenase family)
MSPTIANKILSRYGLSKLLLLFAVRHLAVLRPVSRTGVTINIVHPGMCKTGLTRNMNPVVRFLAGATKMLFGRTAEAGSRAVLYGMAAGEPSHGKYLADCQIAEYGSPTRNSF